MYFLFQILGSADPNSQLTNPLSEPLEAMYNEAAPEFVVDQSMYTTLLLPITAIFVQDWNRPVIGMTTIECLV